MPANTIDYFYSVRSSFTYLGAARLNALAAQYGLRIAHHPLDLSAVVSAYDTLHGARTTERAYAGARVLETDAVRERYTRLEYSRWGARLGIAIKLDPSHHYGPRELPSGAVILAQQRGLNADALSHAILQALWRDDLDIADPAVIAGLLAAVGIDVDPQAFCADAMSPQVQAEFMANAPLALASGVFGSPSYLFAGELFFGQDRLDFLQAAIVAALRPDGVDSAPAKQ